jgi:hypothetical protein
MEKIKWEKERNIIKKRKERKINGKRKERKRKGGWGWKKQD